MKEREDYFCECCDRAEFTIDEIFVDFGCDLCSRCQAVAETLIEKGTVRVEDPRLFAMVLRERERRNF